MHCPFCNYADTKVTDSRLATDTNTIRRRRSCLQCQGRFTTYETVEVTLPRVVKRDHSREAFDEQKIRDGMLSALQKRPVSTEAFDKSMGNIIKQARLYGEKEIASEQLGQWVMDELKKLDHVAYVRFASVYRRFKDIDEFKQEIERLIE